MTDSAEKVLVTFQDGVKRITINHPERRNSVDRETVQSLLAAVRHSAERRHTRFDSHGRGRFLLRGRRPCLMLH
jgi:enoyl-CoA hydratase/carnithine racemase